MIEQIGITSIFVTHDQDEAMSVADRIAVMNKGKVEQFDTPVAIYDRPQTLFVNGFIGTTNLMNGKVASLQNGMATIALDAGASLSLRRRLANLVGERPFSGTAKPRPRLLWRIMNSGLMPALGLALLRGFVRINGPSHFLAP